MELDERQKLEEEIRKKQEEIEEVKNVVDEKDEETKRLQEEMAEAKRQLEVNCDFCLGIFFKRKFREINLEFFYIGNYCNYESKGRGSHGCY